jgi:hypothetical protein
MKLPIPPLWRDAAPALLLALRRSTDPPQAWLAALEDPVNAPLRDRVAPLLDRVLMLDLPELRVAIRPAHLAQWGVTPAEAWATARTNLSDRSGRIGVPAPIAERPGVWEIRGPGSAALLTLPGWLNAFAGSVAGEPIAVAPDDRCVWVTGTENRDEHEALTAWATDRWRQEPHPISPLFYRADGRALIPWEPEGNPALLHHHRDLRCKFAGGEYAAQSRPLEAWLANEGRPERVAPLAGIRRGSGALTSWTSWAGGPALLPAADLVYLGDPNGRVPAADGMLPWSRLPELGVEVQPAGLPGPERYRVDGPDPGGRS